MSFKKGESGNPNGRPHGAKSEKTKQWESLGESITGHQAEQFNAFLDKLWNSRNDEDKMIAFLDDYEKLYTTSNNFKNVFDCFYRQHKLLVYCFLLRAA